AILEVGAVLLPLKLAPSKLSHEPQSVTKIMDEACVHQLIVLPPQFQTQLPARKRRRLFENAGGSFMNMKTWSLPDARYFQIGALASLLSLNFALIDFGAQPLPSAIAIGSSLLTQFICARVTSARFDWRSAMITGLSLSLLLRADALWLYAAAG